MPIYAVYICKVSPAFQVNPASKLFFCYQDPTQPILSTNNNNKMTFKHNKKPNTTINGLEALRNRRDACLKAKNPNSKEIKEVTKIIRNLKKKASKNAEPKRSTKEAVRLATKRANKASKAKAKEAKKAKKAYKAKAAK
ncbi:hypothetical protein X797_012356 [Metarhizium robertsii]|uniref:Uncharacterized protein n=1 Tax=Metarhizium robertsii TaxID=568076 RepID=A0A014N4H0_9HYPO|nr:hypothetical protein X797_012356 [Metarhizium robertsii]